jgi:hypothetical protein
MMAYPEAPQEGGAATSFLTVSKREEESGREAKLLLFFSASVDMLLQC